MCAQAGRLWTIPVGNTCGQRSCPAGLSSRFVHQQRPPVAAGQRAHVHGLGVQGEPLPNFLALARYSEYTFVFSRGSKRR